MILGRVKNNHQISNHVKNYVSQHANQEEPPFQETHKKISKSSAKRKSSLSDWRVLYNKTSLENRNSESKRMNKTQRILNDRKKQSKAPEFKTKKRQTVQSRNSDHNELNITSALMQNFYDSEIFVEKRAETAKIKNYYEDTPHQRPASMAWSRRRAYEEFPDHHQKLQIQITRSENKKTILNHLKPEKYEKIKILRKYLLKREDLDIEGLKKIKHHPQICSGLRYTNIPEGKERF